MIGGTERTDRRVPVAMLTRSRLRSGRASLVVVAILVAITGAAAITALTGAQRTLTAYDRLREATGDPDGDVTGRVGSEAVRRVADLPDVEASVGGHLWVSRYLDITDRIIYLSTVSYDRTSSELVDPFVVEGRRFDADAPTEAVVTEGFADRSGVEIGSTIGLKLLLGEQFRAWDQVNPVDARGPEVRLRVVGVIRDPFDAGASGAGLFASPAFTPYVTDLGGPPLADATYVRLRDGTDGGERFAAAVADLVERYGDPGQGETDQLRVTLTTDREDVHAAARVAALGLVVFAAVAALAGLVTLTQALGREMGRRGNENEVWSALGMSPRDRALALAVPVLLATAAGTVGAVVLAVAASPITPIGAARTFEPHPGIEVNLALLAIGGAAWLLLIGLLVALTARRGTRVAAPEPDLPTGTTPSPLTAPVVRSNLPVPVTVGLRMAVEQRVGRRINLTRTPVVTAALAIGAVVATVAFSASLVRLVSEPSRYGWAGDGTIEVPSEARVTNAERIASEPEVEAATLVSSLQGTVGGERTTVYGLEPLRGTLGFTILSGRAPAAPDEIVLGPDLASDLDVVVGDAVPLEAGASAEGRRVMRVVGLGLTIAADGEGFDGGALVTGPTFDRLEPGRHYAVVYFRLVDSVDDAQATASRIAGDLELSDPRVPGPVSYLDQLRNLPRLLALLLGAVGVAAVAHGFVVGSRRWSYDLAVLRVFGFTRRQTGQAIATMATATIGVGALIGVPLGLVAARVAWTTVASDVNVATDLARPIVSVVLLVLAAVAIANLVAAIGSRAVRRGAPGFALRTE